MSYYVELLKSNNKTIVPSSYEIGADHKKIEEVSKKVLELQKKLEESLQELADKKEEIIESKYHMLNVKRYVDYKRTGIIYDWDTCSPVEGEMEQDGLVFESREVSGAINAIVGVDYSKGALIIGEYSYRINSAKQKLTHRFIKQKIWSFCQCGFIGENGELARSSYWDYFQSNSLITKEFIKKFFDTDYKGSMELKELSECFKKNASFEIILHEAPENIIDKLLKKSVDTATPIHKIVGLTRPMYERFKNENLLNMLLKVREDSYWSRGFFSQRTENELYEEFQIFKGIAEDLEFYKMSASGYARDGEDLVVDVAETFYGSYAESNVIRDNYTFKKFVNYIGQEAVNQGYSTLKNMIGELRDYLRMCRDMEIKPILNSSYLSQTHNICSRNYKIKLDEYQEKAFQGAYDGYKDIKINDKYWMIVPKKAQDVKDEGNALNHCVASYIKKIIEGETLIFFLRTDPEISLITVEVRNGKAVQIRGSHNRNPIPKETAAINSWVEKINKDKEKQLNLNI